MAKKEEMVWILTVEQHAPIHPWVQGTLKETTSDRTFVASSYGFLAKVFDEGSKFGINNGRISKLSVWKNELECKGKNYNRRTIAHYDRGWDMYLESSTEKEVLRLIIDGLEKSPKVTT